VQTYIDRLQYALDSGSVTLFFQADRRIDSSKDKKYTNRYTLAKLFPDQDEVVVLKRELSYLSIEEYIETVKDTRYPKRSEMRVFCRQYNEGDVYIKIRVELISMEQAIYNNYIFVMSFHFAEWEHKESDFPYREGGINK